MRPKLQILIGLLLLPWLLLLSACNDKPVESGKKKRTPPVHLVEVIEIQPRELQLDYQRSGDLKYRRLAHIYNQIEGQIISFPWFEGDQVTEGVQLVQLDDRLLKAEQSKTRANVRQARQDLRRIQKLAQKKVASEDEVMRTQTILDVAQAEQKIQATRIAYTDIRSPFDGIIVERLAEPGDVKPRHSHLLTLADPASLIVQVWTSELLLPQLATGDPVQIRIDALGDKSYQGSILRIHPQLDPASRQGILEVQFDLPPTGAQSGQFARVSFSTRKSSRLMIPFSALHRDRQGEYVYVLSQGKATHTQVHSGVKIKQDIEILQGLAEGQQVIVRGFIGLTDQKMVKVAGHSAET